MFQDGEFDRVIDLVEKVPPTRELLAELALAAPARNHERRRERASRARGFGVSAPPSTSDDLALRPSGRFRPEAVRLR